MPLLSRIGLALLIAAAALGPRMAAAQGLTECADIVVLDPGGGFGDPASSGVVDEADLDLAPGNNVMAAGGGPESAFLAHAAVGPGRIVWLTDLEADPAGLGPDPNGNPGRGAVLAMDPETGALSVTAASDLFVDPIGIAYSPVLDLLVVVDLEADPSGFGPDTLGRAGHGAIFTVDPGTGGVALLADGSNYPPGIPGGAPSIFEDPLAVAFAPDGTLYVADQLANPTPFGSAGAVFRVDVGTGEVALVSSSAQFRGLRDIAVEPDGNLLVVDRIATSTGSLYRLDPASGAILAGLPGTDLVEPSGVVVSGDGRIWLVDASAASVSFPGSGLVQEVDTALTGVVTAAADASFVGPWALDLLEPAALRSATPGAAEQGQALTVTLRGGVFLAGAAVDFGAGVTVDAVRVLDPATIEADVMVSPGATIGLRDVTVENPDRTHAFHCDLFEIVPPAPCAVTSELDASLRVERLAGGVVRLTWEPIVDACLAEYVVRRAFAARPDTAEGTWPDDPEFTDISTEDLEGGPADAAFAHDPTAGRSEYYLVTARGTDGSEGASGHYD